MRRDASRKTDLGIRGYNLTWSISNLADPRIRGDKPRLLSGAKHTA